MPDKHAGANRRSLIRTLIARFEKSPSFRILLTVLQVRYETATSAAGPVSGRLFFVQGLFDCTRFAIASAEDVREIDLPSPVREILADVRAQVGELYGDGLVRMIAYGSRIRGDAKLDSDHLDVSAFENEDDPFVENVRREGAMILDCGDRILAPPYDPDLAELIDGYRDTVEKYDELLRRLAE